LRSPMTIHSTTTPAALRCTSRIQLVPVSLPTRMSCSVRGRSRETDVGKRTPTGLREAATEPEPGAHRHNCQGMQHQDPELGRVGTIRLGERN
jgi:hypothetical protein